LKPRQNTSTEGAKQVSVSDFARRKITEAMMRTLVLAAVFASALTAGAMAQTYDSSIPPRDPPFGKGNADNDTFHQPSQTDSWRNARGSMTYGETWVGTRRPDHR
jgi:hypothetical protein